MSQILYIVIFLTAHPFASRANACWRADSHHSKMATSSQLGSFAVCDTCETLTGSVNWDALRWRITVFYVSNTQQGPTIDWRLPIFSQPMQQQQMSQSMQQMVSTCIAWDRALEFVAILLILSCMSSWIQRKSCVYLHLEWRVCSREQTKVTLPPPPQFRGRSRAINVDPWWHNLTVANVQLQGQSQLCVNPGRPVDTAVGMPGEPLSPDLCAQVCHKWGSSHYVWSTALDTMSRFRIHIFRANSTFIRNALFCSSVHFNCVHSCVHTRLCADVHSKMLQVAHMDVWRCTFECVMSHIWMCQVTHIEWHVTHLNEVFHTQQNILFWWGHTYHVNHFCHEIQQVMPHIYEGVKVHIWRSHVTQLNIPMGTTWGANSAR